MTLIDIWWDHVKTDLLLDKEAAYAEAATWNMHPIYVEDDLAAIFLERNNEVHFIKLGKHTISRARLKASPLRVGMTTRVPKDAIASRVFVRRIGFEFTHEDEHDFHYRLEKIRHV